MPTSDLQVQLKNLLFDKTLKQKQAMTNIKVIKKVAASLTINS